MSSNFKIAAVALFALAVVCLLLAVVLYFAWNIKAIHSELTGKTAQQRIVELRRESGRWGSGANMGAGADDSKKSAVGAPWSASEVRDALDSGSQANSAFDDSVEDENRGTTLLGQAGVNDEVSRAESDVDDDLGTTLLQRPKAGKSPIVEESQEPDDEDLGTTLLRRNGVWANKHEIRSGQKAAAVDKGPSTAAGGEDDAGILEHAFKDIDDKRSTTLLKSTRNGDDK